MTRESDIAREAGEGDMRDMVPDEAALEALAPEPTGPLLMGHPPGLFLLFFVEMWERFSYYGMRALLVLYLIAKVSGSNRGRGWDEEDANLLYGWYTGLAYLFPLIGGYLADKFLGTHRSMVTGGLLIALGHIILAVSGLGTLDESQVGLSVFIAGLAMIIFGTGFFKPTVSVMVGQLYSANDPRRDGAFTIFYMGINLGAFWCAFVCGTLGEKVGWHWGFGSAAVGMLIGLAAYMFGRPVFLKGIGNPPEGKGNYGPLFFIVSVVLTVMVGVAYNEYVFTWFKEMVGWIMNAPIGGGMPTYGSVIIATFVTVVLAWVVWFVMIQEVGFKGPTVSIFIFMLFNAFFWIAFEQAGSTLNVFAESSTDRHVLGYEVPATWFQSVNPFLIFLLAPFFAALWSYLGARKLDPSQPAKIGLGLLLLGGGYVFMVLAAQLNVGGAQVAMFWLIATYTLHTVGELCLSPTGLSFVTKTAHPKYVSFLMGIWFISSFLANLGGGIIASYVKQIEKGELDLFWYRWGLKLGGRADYFLLFVISSFGAGFLILALTPLLKRLYHEKG